MRARLAIGDSIRIRFVNSNDVGVMRVEEFQRPCEVANGRRLFERANEVRRGKQGDFIVNAACSKHKQVLERVDVPEFNRVIESRGNDDLRLGRVPAQRRDLPCMRFKGIREHFLAGIVRDDFPRFNFSAIVANNKIIVGLNEQAGTDDGIA